MDDLEGQQEQGRKCQVSESRFTCMHAVVVVSCNKKISTQWQIVAVAGFNQRDFDPVACCCCSGF